MTENKRFDPTKRKKLNNPERIEWLPPQLMADLLHLTEGSTFVDIGAGTGFLTRAMADLAPEDSLIHALDIEPLMVTEMEQTLPAGGPIRPQLMDMNALPLEDDSVDGAWMIALYHEIGPPEPLLHEILRVLHPHGRLLIVDWDKKEEACVKGPPLAHRIASETAAEQVAAAGFHKVRIVSGFRHHYGITAELLNSEP